MVGVGRVVMVVGVFVGVWLGDPSFADRVPKRLTLSRTWKSQEGPLQDVILTPEGRKCHLKIGSHV